MDIQTVFVNVDDRLGLRKLIGARAATVILGLMNRLVSPPGSARVVASTVSDLHREIGECVAARS